MVPAAAGTAIVIRRLSTPEEYRAVEEVQRAAWGLSTDGPVPSTIQRAIHDNGGILLGAFAGSQMVGFALGFLGREEDRLYHYSHMTGVVPAFQNRHVGRALKLRQREEALAQGLDEIRWTFDPLQSRNAFFNVRRLGGHPDRYFPRYYGTMGDALNEGLETDRLRLLWPLREARVEARLQGQFPSAADDEAWLAGASALIETAVGDQGLRRPATVHPPTNPRVHLEIPADLVAVRKRDPGSARRWREATREAFLLALDHGYRVEDFTVVALKGARRAFYLLARPEESREA